MEGQGLDGLQVGPLGGALDGQGLGLGVLGGFGLVVGPRRARGGGAPHFGLLCGGVGGGGGGGGDV